MDIQLYNGDCLEVMRQFPDKSIDLVVCDPKVYEVLYNYEVEITD